MHDKAIFMPKDPAGLSAMVTILYFCLNFLLLSRLPVFTIGVILPLLAGFLGRTPHFLSAKNVNFPTQPNLFCLLGDLYSKEETTPNFTDLCLPQ